MDSSKYLRLYEQVRSIAHYIDGVNQHYIDLIDAANEMCRDGIITENQAGDAGEYYIEFTDKYQPMRLAIARCMLYLLAMSEGQDAYKPSEEDIESVKAAHAEYIEYLSLDMGV